MERPAIPVLETSRLRLRPLRLSDAPQIQSVFPQWKIVEFLSAAVPWPYPDDGAQAFLETVLPKIAAGQEYDWAITLKSAKDDQLIGIISLYPDGEDSRGFWLAPAHHRQGLMTEAMAAVNDFAFDTLGMTLLILNNAEPNRASHRLKEISGAAIVAVHDDVPYVGGKMRQIQWRLTREDWESHRHSLRKNP